MGGTDIFWNDLLGYFRGKDMPVTVVGPDLPAAVVGDGEQTCTALIGQRLAEQYDLALSPPTTMKQAVAEILRTRGRDEVEIRVYKTIYDILTDLDLKPSDALRNLAAISDLRLFVSTTPDRLLAQALNEVRFGGKPLTREIAFSINQSTEEQASNAPKGDPTDTVVLNLFGQASRNAQYAIHEEDELEWLHALLTRQVTLPLWLDSQLKKQPMLFIGCDIPDWDGRFFVRMESKDRLTRVSEKQFFFVNAPDAREPLLSSFFSTYGRGAVIQQLEMEPADFIAELRARWEKLPGRRPVPDRQQPGSAGSPAADDRPIFISYLREDSDAARRLCDAITEIGGPGAVWFDERKVSPGDDWEENILATIRRDIQLFVPVISANTEREDEGVVYQEWREAVDRSERILGRRFIVPVIIDDDAGADLSRYHRIPEQFRRLDFGHAPAGVPDPTLRTLLQAEIRAMRTRDAS